MLVKRRIRQRAGASAAADYERLEREWRHRNRRTFRWLALICLGIAVAGLIVGLRELRGGLCGLIAGGALVFLILAREYPDQTDRLRAALEPRHRAPDSVSPAT